MEPETAVVSSKEKEAAKPDRRPLKPAISGTANMQSPGLRVPLSSPLLKLSGKAPAIRMFEERLNPVRSTCAQVCTGLDLGAVEDDISPPLAIRFLLSLLPRPPPSELQNLTAIQTIQGHPELFKIICNINVKKLEELLVDHPNQPFVQSVITGLTEGFGHGLNLRMRIRSPITSLNTPLEMIVSAIS